MVAADYSQLELRILADRTADPLLVDVYTSGRDLHNETQKRLGLSDRRLAKILNFLVTYGGGPKKYRENLLFDAKIDRSAAQCKADVNNFYDTYARIRPWKEEILAEGRRNGVVQSRIGRHRHVPDLNSLDMGAVRYAERQSVNTCIQGDAADLVMCAMIELARVGGQVGLSMHMMVHDEIVASVDTGYLEETKVLIKDVMESILPNALVPIVVDVGSGPSWGEAR